MPESTSQRPPSRRQEYAEATRQAVIGAARELFGQQGYARTTVEEIARQARVSAATVYAQCGGKRGLLETLIEVWTSDSVVQEIVNDCAKAPTSQEMLGVLAEGYLTMFRMFGDIMRTVIDAAVSTPAVATFLDAANAHHQGTLATIVATMRERGELAEGLSDDDIVKIIFYHFRFEQLWLVTHDFGWGETRARDWIRERVELAILKP